MEIVNQWSLLLYLIWNSQYLLQKVLQIGKDLEKEFMEVIVLPMEEILNPLLIFEIYIFY